MEIVHRRAMAMIEALGIEVSPNTLYNAYYGLIDFEFWARKKSDRTRLNTSRRTFTRSTSPSVLRRTTGSCC